MISQMDKFREGPLAETEIHVPPSSQEDRVLSRLSQNFHMSKAQQILRLLRDQDDLNQRFRDCSLVDDDEEAVPKPSGGRCHDEDNPDDWSNGEEQYSVDDGGSDTSGHESDRRATRRVALRNYRNSIDPGRCKTSMGFHNRAEVTEIPYATDSDNVAGLDSTCSTPRGVSSGALSALQPTNHHGQYGTDNAKRGSGNSRLRVYHLKIGENDPHARDADIPEECVVQSARSCRPKTSLTSMANSRNQYYRQQPLPESHPKPSKQGHVHHSPNYHSRPQHGHQQHNHSHGVGNTRQAIISRLDPHHPMAVRPFFGSQEDVGNKTASGQQQSSSQPTTPRGGVPVLHHTEVKLFDMAPSFSPKNSPAAAGFGARRGVGGELQGAAGLARTLSFSTDHQRRTPANRALLSVDSSPLPLGSLSPRGARNPPGDDPITPRRVRSMRVKKRVGEMPRVVVPASMQPTMAVMKLPPLDSSAGKSGSGRDLVCVGKD